MSKEPRVGSTAILAMLSCLLNYEAFGQQAGGWSDSEILAALAPELMEAQTGSIDILSQAQRRKVDQTRAITEVKAIGFRFEGDFNHDGQEDLALLGRFRQDGQENSFVLMATRDSEDWARASLLTFEQEFIIGVRYDDRLAVDDRLVVFFCTGCDHSGRIQWTGSDYIFELNRPVGVPSD